MDFKIEDIDYKWVEATSNKQALKKALKMIQDDGGYYPDLEAAIRKRINEGGNEFISSEEINKAKLEVLNWEKEITEVDKDLSPINNPENNKVNLQVLNFQQEKEAEKLKILGNEAMKTKGYLEAITKYTESIKINPKESSTYCNRALAYIKINDFNKALEDCNKTLELSPTYDKAYYRRASCYTELKRFEEAWEDYKTLLTRIQNNSEILNEINMLKSKWRAHIGEQEWSKISSKLIITDNNNNKKDEKVEVSNTLKNKSETTNNQNLGFKRIKIEEVENEDEANKKFSNLINSSEKQDKLNLNDSNLKQDSNSTPTITAPKDNKSKINKDDLKNVEKTAENINIPKHSENIKISKKTPTYDESKVLGAISIATEDLDFSYYRKNSTGFQQAYSSFMNNSDKFFEFLKYFTAEDFLKCFDKIELSFEILQFMIKVFCEKENDIKNNSDNYNLVLAYMINITKTRNFMIKKIMIKAKKQAFEPVINLFKNEKSVNIEKLYF